MNSNAYPPGNEKNTCPRLLKAFWVDDFPNFPLWWHMCPRCPGNGKNQCTLQAVHLALVGDLAHGRTAHSKASAVERKITGKIFRLKAFWGCDSRFQDGWIKVGGWKFVCFFFQMKIGDLLIYSKGPNGSAVWEYQGNYQNLESWWIWFIQIKTQDSWNARIILEANWCLILENFWKFLTFEHSILLAFYFYFWKNIFCLKRRHQHLKGLKHPPNSLLRCKVWGSFRRPLVVVVSPRRKKRCKNSNCKRAIGIENGITITDTKNDSVERCMVYLPYSHALKCPNVGK